MSVNLFDAPARGAKTTARALRSFYSRPVAWAGAVTVSATLSFVGGTVMFWLHAIYRMEHGPEIGHVQHWLLDSTLGFVALTPVVFLLLPATLWLRRHDRAARLRLGLYVLTVGVLFALVTGPGPLLHNTLVGADTPLANWATDLFGRDPSVAAHHAKENSVLTEGLLQVAVGIPTYSLLTLAAVAAMRRVLSVRWRPRLGADAIGLH
jgi:hypothetical protein